MRILIRTLARGQNFKKYDLNNEEDLDTVEFSRAMGASGLFLSKQEVAPRKRTSVLQCFRCAQPTVHSPFAAANACRQTLWSCAVQSGSVARETERHGLVRED